MSIGRNSLILVLVAVCATACSGPDGDPVPQPTAAAAAATTPPFEPVVGTLELMQSLLGHAAEDYWESVAIVVDEQGVHELFPETDEDWERVWAAAVAIAESGNLLMMEPRARDQGEWLQWSRALIARGKEAIAAAVARDPEQVLAAGEQVYYVCVGCHERYIVTPQ